MYVVPKPDQFSADAAIESAAPRLAILACTAHRSHPGPLEEVAHPGSVPASERLFPLDYPRGVVGARYLIAHIVHRNHFCI